jgi:ATP-binding cassette subfamily B protein
MLASAIAEMVSLGMVLPFLAALTGPERIFSYPMVSDLALRLGINHPHELVLPLAVLFCVAALVSNALRLLLLWANNRLAYTIGNDLGIELYLRTLYQPYRVHVKRNSSVVISGITQKTASATKILLAILTIVSSAILIVAVMLTLIAINPLVAALAGAGFGISYAAVGSYFRHRILQNGRRVAHEHVSMIKAVQEGLGSVRDILLDGTQQIYCRNYAKADRQLRLADASNTFVSGAPRFIMEALGMVLIVALAYSLSRGEGGATAALPVLGALALGAQKLLPVLQQAYAAWASMVANHSIVSELLDMLDQPLPQEATTPLPAPRAMQRCIQLESVRFRHSSNEPWVLDGLNLLIPKGARIGIVGSTGSGKSTLLDLLMGLLEPTEGRTLVDGESLDGNRLRAWQRTIAHVPQSIYLSDSSVAENIALGVPRKAIDMERVRLAAGRAQIADFIEQMQQGYDTPVGERGIRLSGGQRQRIGIARALYKEASILVLDEATSALDNVTENTIMSAIENLDHELTILIIAHRVTTLRYCDRIVELADGRAIVYDSYVSMLANSSFARNDMLGKSKSPHP